MANVRIQRLLLSFNRSAGAFPKKVSGVVSKYTDGQTSATISASVVEAVGAWFAMQNETDPDKIPGGVGTRSGLTVAELKVGSDKVHLITLDNAGKVNGAIQDTFTSTLVSYQLGQKEDFDGAAVMLALMPELLSDGEFQSAYEAYEEQKKGGKVDDDGINAMAMMCDNAYRRIMDKALPEALNIDLKSATLPKIANLKLERGDYKPDAILAGRITSFGGNIDSDDGTAKVLIDQDQFAGKFRFSERDLTEGEQKLIPELPQWYVVSQNALTICQHAAVSIEGFLMRNFLMRGPAGTGKTEDAKAIASGALLPYVSETCNPATEVFDLIGQVVPDTSAADNATGSFSFTWDDLLFAPEMVYENVTGQKSETCSIEAFAAALAKQIGGSDSGTKFRYVESGLVKALKYGWVCEIREPSVITNQGVLVGLNSILEQDGEVVMPVTGERFKRHDDAIVVMTTNSDYEGCRAMNQSVIDRMDLVLDVDEPSKDVMIQRAMARTNEEDESMVEEMVEIITNVKEKLRELGDTTGEAGMRSLISWIMSTRVTKDPYKSALITVFAKATTDLDTREMLKAETLDISAFASSRR